MRIMQTALVERREKSNQISEGWIIPSPGLGRTLEAPRRTRTSLLWQS